MAKNKNRNFAAKTSTTQRTKEKQNVSSKPQTEETKKQDVQNTQQQKETRNILITYVSLITKTDVIPYTYKNNRGEIKELTAILTNESAFKYLCEYLGDTERKLDYIYAFCTKEVLQKRIKNFSKSYLEEIFEEKPIVSLPSEKASIDSNNLSFFQKVFKKSSQEQQSKAKENLNLPELEQITTIEYFEKCVEHICGHDTIIERLEVSTDSVEKVVDIMKVIQPNDKIFIDITGGMRDAVFSMVLLSRCLEFTGNQVEKVFYSNYQTKTITEFTSTFKLMTLLNGFSEFSSFASINTLSNYFKDTKNKNIKDLIFSMREFTDAITLGKTMEIDKKLQILENNIKKFEQQKEIKDISETILKYMTQLIRNKFFKNGNMDLISILEWCLENKLVQQALTLYIERIPKYLFDKRILQCEKEYQEKLNKKKDPSIEKYYYIFWSDYLSYPNNNMLNKVRNKIINIETEKDIQDILKKEKDPILKEVLCNLKEIYEIAGGMNTDIKTKDYHKYSLAGKSKSIKYLWKKIYENHNINKFSDICSKTVPNEIVIALIGINDNLESFQKKMYFIRNFEECSKMKIEYTFQCDEEEFHNICISYIFFKAIRNEINHASEKENLTEEDKKYFNYLGFHTDISVDDVIEDMKASIEQIKKLSIKPNKNQNNETKKPCKK